jgi:O-succinylbenzoate synthase
MRVRKIELREIHLPLLAPFETSFGSTSLRRIVLVEVDVDGTAGWGEVTAGEDPFYSYETTGTAWRIISDYVWPILRDTEFGSAAQVFDLLARIRGHQMAKAGVETAIWDAEAKQKNMPLWKLIGGTRIEIPCGVSIGIQPSIDELIAKVEKELRAGYQRIKIKIKPGKDVEPVAGGREFRLYTGGCAAAQETRCVSPNDDRAAAGSRRHLQPRYTAEAAGDSDLPG